MGRRCTQKALQLSCWMLVRVGADGAGVSALADVDAEARAAVNGL